MFNTDLNTLSGPDFLDAVADAEAANGLDINAATYRQRAEQWRREQQAREEAEATRPATWPPGQLNRETTVRVLTEHNAWRRGADGPQTDPVLLGRALDAAVAAITAHGGPLAAAPAITPAARCA